MSRLTDLIAKAKSKDAALGAELDREFKMLSSRLPFGLNFERHSPEAVELPLRPIRKRSAAVAGEEYSKIQENSCLGVDERSRARDSNRVGG